MKNWKPVAGLEDRYEVSREGKVRNIRRGKGSIFHQEIKWRKNRYGYWWLNLKGEGGYENRTVHRIVALSFLGPCPEGMEVNHIDGDRGNPHLENLEYVTRAENIQHAFRNCRTKPGSKTRPRGYKNLKFTEEQIREIRKLAARPGHARAELARRFKVSPSLMTFIINRNTYNWVTD